MANRKKSKIKARRERRRRRLLMLLSILVFVLAVALCILILTKPKGTERDSFFDPNAQTGVMIIKSEEERKAELDKIVQEGMFNISIASVVVVENDGQTARVRIENIAANHHHMSVAIKLDESERIIYESAGLSPGQYIETARFNQKLASGNYDATAIFTAYDMETLEVEGTAGAKIRILVP